MKTAKTLAILISIVCLSLSVSFAQSKKKLKEEVATLKTENARINQENAQLESTNQRLTQENKGFSEQNMTLRSQVTQLQRDNDALNKQYDDLNTAYQGVKGDYEALQASQSANPGGSLGGGGVVVNPNDNRKCAFYQGKLEPGWTYTELYNKLNSDGWGIQVFASKSLCQAAEAAEEFKGRYTMYKTYIRCKAVNGQQVYAVVYGSLKYQDQAKTYLNNFKAKAAAKWSANAFLVQH